MTQEFAEKLISGHLRPLYGFALRRCASLQDAEDLTQEICLKLWRALTHRTDIADAERFVWTVAHNALANYYRDRARHGFGALPEELPDGSDLFGSLANAETVERLQSEIAYLSKTQRQIVIMYYYENRRQKDIADALKIPFGTVKWHLSEARKNLKRGMEIMKNTGELKFNPIHFKIVGTNGSAGDKGGNRNYIHSALAENILYAAYREALTVNEIADALGVSPVYVESETEYLEENGFMLKQGKGYLANVLIDEPTTDLNRLQGEMYSKAAQLFAPELFDALHENVNRLGDGIICPRNDLNFALWALIPYVAAFCDDESIARSVSFEEAATIRPDGGQNICYCSVLNPTAEPPMYWDSMLQLGGPSWNGDYEDMLLWLIDTEWSEKRMGDYHPSTLERDYALMKRFIDGELSPEEIAHMSKRGYLKHEALPVGERTSMQIVWVKGTEARTSLLSLGNAIKERYRRELDALKAPYVKAIMDAAPAHLKKAWAFGLQHTFHCDGWFLLHCLKVLVNSGKLKLPTEEQRASLSCVVVTGA